MVATSTEILATLLNSPRAFDLRRKDVELFMQPATQQHNSQVFTDSSLKRRPMSISSNPIVGGAGGDALLLRSVANFTVGSVRCNSSKTDWRFLHGDVEYTVEFAVRLTSLPGAQIAVFDTTSGGSTSNVGVFLLIRPSGVLRFFIVYGSVGNFIIDADSTAALVASTAYQWCRVKWFGTTPASSNVSFEIGSAAASFHNKSTSSPSGADPTGSLHLGALDSAGLLLTENLADFRITRGIRTETWPPKGRLLV